MMKTKKQLKPSLIDFISRTQKDKVSKENKRLLFYFCFLAGGFYLIYYISISLYLTNPLPFYYRPWEYFEDVVFHSPGQKKVWDALRKGDLSRKFLFKNQDQWHNYVSCDSDGHRSVPFQVEKYPILIVGDCQTWGTGLSDHETIAWQLSENLQIPIYNGGRLPNSLSKILKKESLSDTKLIIEFVTSHLINRHIFPPPFVIEDYQPQMKEYKSLLDIGSPKRYFLPFKILRFFTLSNLLSYFPFTTDAEDFIANKTAEDMSLAVANICNRSKALEEKGYKYLFIPIPQRYYVELLDEEMTSLGTYKTWYKELVQALLAQGVHAIYLDDILRANKDKKLFFQTDTHLNYTGAHLIVQEVAKYLQEKLPL